jgi:hypothetical protein
MANLQEDPNDKILENYYSNIATPIHELTSIDKIFNLVKSRCESLGINPPDKIYGYDSGCPICSSNYNNDNWIVLHPCGHLLCSSCLEQINNIIVNQGICRKCPLCRTKSKWIGSSVDNLRTVTQTSYQNNSNIGWATSSVAGSASSTNAFHASHASPAPLITLRQRNNQINRHHPYLPIQRSFTINNSTPILNYNQNNIAQIDCKLIKSKPPIMNNSDNLQNTNVLTNTLTRCEISTQNALINHDNKLIGNLSVIVGDNQNQDNNNNGLDLIIVFDVSGSMSSVSLDGIEILKYIVDSLDSKDRLSVIVFDSIARQLFPLQPMTTIIKSQAKEIINTCFTGGSTNFTSALKLLNLVKSDGLIPTRPFTVIMLSDGQPDTGLEGFEQIPLLYTGDIKPTVYSCTFGQNVSADSMKHILTNQNAHNYRHIDNMNEFKTLVSEIGFDKNIVIGTNLNIKLKNIKALSSIVINSVEDPTITEIKIDQIKTNDMFTIPIEYMDQEEADYEITISYTDLNNTIITVQQVEIETPGNFILNHYWYKIIIQMIRDLNTLSSNQEKLSKLEEIKLLAISDNLGEFITEIVELIEQTKLIITTTHSNSHSHSSYNNQTFMLNRAISSSASPMIANIYQNSSQPSRNS